MADPWGVLSEEGGRVTLHEVGRRARDFATVEAATRTGGISAQRLIRLDPAPHAAPPTAILPVASGPLGAVRQRAPDALLPANARILIAGALAGRPDWDGIVCLPGALQTLWVHVSAREIVSFQGAATGRIAAAFGARGVNFDADALEDTMARPERLALHLSAAALSGAEGRIMGHLLGAELAAMRAYWLGQRVIVVGDAGPQATALERLGGEVETVPQAEAWQAGLAALGRATGLSA